MALLENSTSNYSTNSEVIIPFCRAYGSLYDPIWTTPKSLIASRSALIATAVTFPFAAFSNALTLLAFYKNPSLRKPANIFLIALAIVDLIKSTVASPLLIVIETRYLNKSEPSCLLTILFTISLMYIQSLFLLAVLNIERFIAIKAPFWHRANITKGILVKIAVAGCILISAFTIARFFTEVIFYPFVLFALIPAVATPVFAILIWWSLKKRSNKVKISSVTNNPEAKAFALSKNSSLPTTKTHLSLEFASAVGDDHQEKTRETHINMMKKGIDDSPISEHIEVLDEVDKQEDQKEEKTRETHIDVIKKKQVHPGVDNSPISEHIEVLDEKNEQEDQKEKEKKEDKNKVKKMWIPTTTSNRYDKAVRSERKAAKIATFLALGLFLTAVLPIAIFFAFWNFDFDHSSTIKLTPSFILLSALVNPVINIGLNNDIRKACKELITCW